jgi:hypothetical protein
MRAEETDPAASNARLQLFDTAHWLNFDGAARPALSFATFSVSG